MKKIILGFLICGSMLSVSAQSDSTTHTVTSTTTTHKYYYYPSSNVYFDEASGNYWYWDNGSKQWSMTQNLPSTITLEKTPQYNINYQGDDPWKNNAGDLKKYRVKKNGTVKMKTKDNG